MKFVFNTQLKAQSNIDSEMTYVNLPNNVYYVSVCHVKAIPLYSLHFLGKLRNIIRPFLMVKIHLHGLEIMILGLIQVTLCKFR